MTVLGKLLHSAEREWSNRKRSQKRCSLPEPETVNYIKLTALEQPWAIRLKLQRLQSFRASTEKKGLVPSVQSKQISVI